MRSHQFTFFRFMTDPFAIQVPAHEQPIHRINRRFFGARGRGYEIDDHQTDQAESGAYLGISIKFSLVKLLSLFIISVFTILLLRAASLQLAHGASYRALAEGNRLRLETIPAHRGIIFDRRGVPLAENTPFLVLALRPIDFPRGETERLQIIELLRQAGIDHAPVLDLVEKNKHRADWMAIKENLTHDEAVKFEVLFANAPEIRVRLLSRRLYNTASQESLAHLLGYQGKIHEEEIERLGANGYEPTDSIGRAGIESSYETILRGTNGRKHIEVDALGREKEIIAKEEAQNGSDLILNLDTELQKQAENSLKTWLRASGKKRGAIVAVDPRDGAVRALLSWPPYDNNAFALGLSQDDYKALVQDTDQPLFGRAISGTYPSGSTIKPLLVGAALEEKIITPQTTIMSTGGINVGKWFFPDWKEGGHGPTDAFRAIAESVNTFFYYIGGGYGRFEGLGPERMAAWARRFGLGEPTGIDLPSEVGGFIPSPTWKKQTRGEPWYIGDSYHFAIGQGDVLVTPLQMAMVTTIIANGGTKFVPRLVQTIRPTSGEAIDKDPAPRDREVVSSDNLKIVREAMRRAVIDGSARRLADLSIAVAGKTGSAEWHRNRPPHSWFVGFAPYQEPKLALAVLVEEGGEGSALAVPIAKEIFAWFAKNIDDF